MLVAIAKVHWPNGFFLNWSLEPGPSDLWIMSPFQIDNWAKAPQTTPRKLALLTSSPLGLFGSEVGVRRWALYGDRDSAAPSGSAGLLPNQTEPRCHGRHKAPIVAPRLQSQRGPKATT